MFLKKVARWSLKKKKKSSTPQDEDEEDAVFCEEPKSVSDSSSAVEYIEDDNVQISHPKYVLPKDEDAQKPKSEAPKQQLSNNHHDENEHIGKDTMPIRSIIIPAKTEITSDEGSNCSYDKIFTSKLPSHLKPYPALHKSHNIYSRKELDDMSEEGLTQATTTASDSNTVSDTGTYATSESSVKYDEKKRRQLEYWTEVLGDRISRSRVDGESLMELGTMNMYCEQYDTARKLFNRAISVYEANYGPNDLRVAKALEKAGNVECASYAGRQDQKNLDVAIAYLDRAFRIRLNKLGDTHVDTVETLNKIGRVLMKQKDFSGAKKCYYEVLKMREAIFGSAHPCVAISAHMLATAHIRLFEAKAAKFYFEMALKTYEANGLGRHSFADTIRRDLYDLACMKTRFEV